MVRSHAINAGFTGIRRGENAWVDYDGDGDLDVILTGRIDNVINRRTLLYRNDGGQFVNVSTNFEDVDLSSVDWADYDADGDPDLLLTGTTGGQFISYIYRNDNGSFTQIDAGLPGIQFGKGRWGDYDADGDQDIILTGATPSGRLTEIYRNDSGSFTGIGAPIPGVSKSTAEWADFNKDGLLDVFVSGQVEGQTRHAGLYLAVPAASSSAAPGFGDDFISITNSGVPTDFALLPNYPNPFNPTTTMRYALPEASNVYLAVYDLTGKQVAVLADGFQDAGTYEVAFDGSGLASGVYLTRMETLAGVFTRQMILLK